MKLIPKSDLQKKNSQELTDHMHEVNQKLRELSFESRTSQKGNMHLARSYRKQIALLKTLLSQTRKEA